LSRFEFEQLCRPTIERVTVPLDEAFAEAGLRKSDIDDVIMVGGSSKITAVREKLQKYFEGLKIDIDNNPEEKVAQGAAILGNMVRSG